MMAHHAQAGLECGQKTRGHVTDIRTNLNPLPRGLYMQETARFLNPARYIPRR